VRIVPDLPRTRFRGTIGVARRAGLLAYGYDRSPGGLPATRASQWHDGPGPLAEYSSGPAPDSHRLPSSSTRRGGRNPSIFPSIPD